MLDPYGTSVTRPLALSLRKGCVSCPISILGQFGEGAEGNIVHESIPASLLNAM